MQENGKCAGPGTRFLSPSLVLCASKPHDHGEMAKFDPGGLQSINTGTRVNARLLSLDSTGGRAQMMLCYRGAQCHSCTSP